MAQSTPKSPNVRRRRPLRNAERRSFGGVLGGFLGAITLSALAGLLVTVAITPVIAISGATAKTAIDIFNDLPDHINPGELAQPSSLWAVDSAGNEKHLADFYDQNREMVGWDDISQHIKDAVVATEDPRFYTHGGVDILSLGRAAADIALGRSFSGASTISMQYVRNVLIQEAEAIVDEEERRAKYLEATRQDPDRKLQEIRYAISVEKQFSKDEILLGYLNIALFGGVQYGIESAAQYYFGKSASQVTLPEAATLIGIVKDPDNLRIDVEANLAASEGRRDYVLGRMLDEQKITQAQYDEAIATPLEPVITPRHSGCSAVEDNEYALGHFCNYVMLYIANDPSFGNTSEDRLMQVRRGGLKIMTTIDLDMQQAAISSIQSRVPAQMDGIDVGAAASSVEVGTGRVLAMAQNRLFHNDPTALAANPALTSVNYNTDFEYGGSHGFQVGSTFKAFTLAAWIDAGNSLHERVNSNGRTVQESSFKGHCYANGVYGPGNFEFQNDQGRQWGSQSVQQVIAQSINGGIVSMAQKLDMCDLFDIVDDLGVHRASPQRDTGLPNFGETTISRIPSNTYGGTDEIAPITMASAFAGFAGQGTVCSPVPIDSITGPDGEAVPFTKSECHNGLTPEVAAGVAYALEYTVTDGLARHAQSPYGVPHIAKTGTTDSVVDNWTVGASSEVATAVWVGNVTGKVSTQLFGGWTGLMVADQTIWPAIMNVADQKYGGSAFPEPPQSATKQTMVTVPEVSGRDYEEAEELLTALGFTVEDGGEEDSSLPEGRVSRTSPGAGESAILGSTIMIHTSNGRMSEIPEIPDDATGDEARSILMSAGFTSVSIACAPGTGPSSDPGDHRIESISPSSGTPAVKTSQVRVLVDCEEDD